MRHLRRMRLLRLRHRRRMRRPPVDHSPAAHCRTPQRLCAMERSARLVGSCAVLEGSQAVSKPTTGQIAYPHCEVILRFPLRFMSSKHDNVQGG